MFQKSNQTGPEMLSAHNNMYPREKQKKKKKQAECMKGLKHKAYNRMCLCCKGKFRKSYDMSSDPASGSLFLVASYLKVASYCNIYMQYFSKKDFGEIAQPQRLKTKNWLSGSLSCSSCKKFSLRLSLTSRQADGSAAVPFVVVF